MKRISENLVRPFYVILWDFNRDDIEYYDVMPYLVGEYNRLKPSDRPIGRGDIRDFILKESQYQFWSRCQYEVIVSGWPKQNRERKIDVHQQIEKNIETITDLFISFLE